MEQTLEGAKEFWTSGGEVAASLTCSPIASSRRSTQIKTYSWDNAQVLLVANKCDMEDERVVSSERGRQLADHLGEWPPPSPLGPGTRVGAPRAALKLSSARVGVAGLPSCVQLCTVEDGREETPSILSDRWFLLFFF